MTFRTRKSSVLVALCRKRSQLSREIIELEAQLERKRKEVETLDCTMVLLGMSRDEDIARPRRVYTIRFGKGELKRMIVDILKTADGPMTTRQVTDEVRLRKRMLQDYRPHVKRALTRYRITIQVGKTESGESLWTLKGQAAMAKVDSKPSLRLVRSQ
ncbi:MAG TPA: hypothetical protein VKA04_10340 [Pseudodesulfovibrio sp.]|nr:hypothetical protein [Pseudodesulfovibrio sp.]